MKHQRTRRAGNPNFRAANSNCREINLLGAAAAKSLLVQQRNPSGQRLPILSAGGRAPNQATITDQPTETEFRQSQTADRYALRFIRTAKPVGSAKTIRTWEVRAMSDFLADRHDRRSRR